MKKYQVGNIIKTKEGDKGIILDIKDKEMLIFNFSIMEPERFKISDIKEKVGDADNTTIIVNGKKTERKKDEDEAQEVENNETIEKEDEEETENDPAETFGELIKLFGKAAIEVGNILTRMVESDEDDN